MRRRGRGSTKITVNSIVLVMSVVQVMAHGGGSFAADRTPFYGIRMPPEVKKLVQLSKTIDQVIFKKILKGTVALPFPLPRIMPSPGSISNFRELLN